MSNSFDKWEDICGDFKVIDNRLTNKQAQLILDRCLLAAKKGSELIDDIKLLKEWLRNR